MTFFGFLSLILNCFTALLSLTVLEEDSYSVSLGGFLLAIFLIGIIFRLLFIISGSVLGGVPSISHISSNLHSYSVSRTKERESKLPRTSYSRTTFDKKSGIRTTTSWRD